MRNDQPTYQFYLTSDRALRPRHRELPNGDVEFAIKSAEAFLVERDGGLAVVYPGVRIAIPCKSPAELVFSRPDWMPRGVGVTALVDGPQGDLLVYVINQTDMSLEVRRGAWLLKGLVRKRPDVPWWQKLLCWIVR